MVGLELIHIVKVLKIRPHKPYSVGNNSQYFLQLDIVMPKQPPSTWVLCTGLKMYTQTYPLCLMSLIIH